MSDELSQLYNIDPFDPVSNIKVGTCYLSKKLKDFGSLELALADYNAGAQTVMRYKGVPPFPETRNYIQKIVSALKIGNN